MGLKTFSEQFRDDLLRINLQTPPDVVLGLTDLGGSLSYSAYKDSRGQDAPIHSSSVSDAGNVLDIAVDIRKYLFKRNLQTPSDIEAAIIDLSANQSETMRNIGSIGTDANINWRSVVVDAGTIDNAAMVTREANLSRNKPRDLTDPSESNTEVLGESYNYTSLLQTIGAPAQINNFIVPNVQSISSTTNKVNMAARALDLKINRYTPDEYQTANIRENILNEVYKRTTYVDEYTNSLKSKTPIDYSYFSFYNLNNKTSMDDLLSKSTTILQNDTALMNIGAYMLNYNLQARFEQNLYSETIGKINLINKNYNSDFPVSTDPLELIKIAKDPLNNLVEKNYAITTPRNFVGKTAQFLLGLEGVISPFDLWESVDLGGKDTMPNFLASNEGLDAMLELDPTGSNSPQNAKNGTAKSSTKNTKDDNALLKKTGGGQRWALYENLLMNKYSPKFDTSAELFGFHKKPKGNYYLGSEEIPPIDILQARDGISIINNNALAASFNKGFDDYDGYEKKTVDIVWANDESDAEGIESSDFGDFTSRDEEFSNGFNFRPNSLMDITQKLLYVGGIDSPIRNLKTKFRDGKMVYSKGNAVKKIEVKMASGDVTKNTYKILDPWDDGFCRTWTKLKPYAKVSHLVRYGELIRRERNSVIDRNANYNIYPTKLNVGTLYDQNMLGKDGIKERFADRHFDKQRARKYMFSIENLAWKGTATETLPAYEQGSNGGRVMWFPPYGLTFNETSSASWTTHKFLGRPEPIYTYNDTERTGTLSWMIIVDHPTILNVLVQKELAKMSDSDVDDILAAFFAGCVEYDIFELARIWGMFSNSDIAFFKDIIAGNYPYPANITHDKQGTYNTTVAEGTKTTTVNQPQEHLKNIIKELNFFFPNDMPYESEATVKDYDVIYKEYVDMITLNSVKQNDKYDYYSTIGYLNATGAQYFLTPPAGNGNSKNSVDIRAMWANIEKSVPAIKSCIDADKNCIVTIGFEASASSLAKAEHNKLLAKRRALSVAQWYAKQLNLPTIEKVSGTDSKTPSFEIQLKRADGSIPVIFKADFSSGLGEKTVDSMFKDVGFNFGKSPIIYCTGSTTTFASKLDYTEPDFYSDAFEKRYYSVLSYPASYARRVTINATITEKEKGKDDTTTDTVPTPVTYNGTQNEGGNVINKRDIATRILNKLIGENEYFEFLKENSPVVFDSLKEKLKYFSPAFHSMTPEGLNSRLTFLQQCLRPGDTILNEGSSDIVNTAFGRPPVCVLRIGDFFNTRMIIETLNIEYVVVGNSVTYDLNPEGIGVQPMLAKVNLTVKYVGGAGLLEPVKQIQNALSYNYYANADIYETRSFGQTNLDERYLENLELAYNSTDLDISLLNLDKLAAINVEPIINYNQLGIIADPKKYPIISVNNPNYKSAHKIQDISVPWNQYYEVDYQDVFHNSYTSYVAYIRSYFGAIGGIIANNKYDVFAMVYGSFATPLEQKKNNEFGAKKDSNNFNHEQYPNLHNIDKVNVANKKGYFTIGYDSFNKSGNYAVTPKLHLYPQVDDRILTGNTVNDALKDYAGVTVPKYVDLDYMNQNLLQYYGTYLKYLNCEEWILFEKNWSLKKDFYALPQEVIINFRNFVSDKFVAYFGELYGDKLQQFCGQRDLFLTLYGDTLAKNCVCNGVDCGTTADGAAIRYLEVVPNENSDTSANVTTFFGSIVDDCLNKYLGIDWDVRTYQAQAAAPDNEMRGMFNYLYYQMSSTNSPNFWLVNGKLYFDFSTGQWKKNSAVVPDVKCKTVFEKLNFENLYFGQISQIVLDSDVLNENLIEFTTKKVVKMLGDSLYTNDKISWIVTSDIPVVKVSGVNQYICSVIDYKGKDEKIISSVATLNTNNHIRIEDIVFYGFVKSFMVTTNIDELNLAMKSYYTDMAHINERVTTDKLIDAFTNYIKSTKSLEPTDTAINTILTAISGYNTKTMADVISKALSPIEVQIATNSGYKVKMFEVADAIVNSYGKLALKEYSKFKSTYSTMATENTTTTVNTE